MAGDAAARVWKALADPTRRGILDLLSERPRTTGELAGAFPLSRFAVMKHLGVLRDAGLVVVRARGRERWHHLNGVPLREAYERWMGRWADQSASTLLRLRQAAEEGAGMTQTTGLAVQVLEIEQEVTVGAPREKVFDALCHMGDWWPHRFVEAGKVHLDPVVGGRFWEEWPGGDGALYATVTQVRRPDVLTCEGPMGMGGPVAGIISFELDEAPGGTRLRCSHRAFGDIDEQTRAAYAEGWGEVMAALRTHLRLPG
jgi:DNA-binding transcriptional ArsR family regulator/uncharacterized protein YndB with AHSA1/START domain